jgi:hypothetical protein
VRIQKVQPAGGLQIPQTTGVVLDIGFQLVDRVLEFLAAVFRQDRKLFGESRPTAGAELREFLFELVIQRLIPSQEAVIQETDGELQVVGMFRYALRQRMHGVTGTERGVPQVLQTARKHRLGRDGVL